jgi:L-amino acid N-acyltransferase YncA
MELRVREAREEDAEQIAAVLNPLIRAGTYTVIDEPIPVEEQREFIRTFPERGVFHVAVCDRSRQVLGLQDVVPLAESRALRHVGEISTFVAPTSHGSGIGKTLSRATFRAAAEVGFTKLMATIRADNPRAIAFYLSQGFGVIGTARRHALVRGRYVDEVLAEKFIR